MIGMNITVSGILSYPKLHRAETLEDFPNGPPKFRCSVMLRKDSVDLQKVRRVIEKLKQEKWGGDIPKHFDLKCLTNLGNDSATADYVALRALNNEYDKPRVIDQNGEDIISPAQCVAGLKCMMSVSIYAYSKSKAVNGISAGINGVKIMETMGELGKLGRQALTNDEMFGGQSSHSSTKTSVLAKVIDAETPKQFTMTEKAIDLGWTKRSDVMGDWNDDQLLLDNGYMTVAKYAWE